MQTDRDCTIVIGVMFALAAALLGVVVLESGLP